MKTEREVICGQQFDEERALYGRRGIRVEDCSFDGPADGESAFKECDDVSVARCFFNLRYPFWHTRGLDASEIEMTEKCRAALWYTEDARITDSRLHGIKALRECDRVTLERCSIRSAEFGWFTRDARLSACTAEGEYLFLRGERLRFSDFALKGKYSFQYVTDAVFENCTLDTKDAFWHAKNVTVRNSLVKGEYLAWYSDGLTLDHCRIVGTQPLCYCKNLRLIDCEMVDSDLAFERSEVDATVTTPVISVKNPRAGEIRLPAAGEIVMDDPEAKGRVTFL